MERTALIEEEARLSHLLHSGRTEPLPPDLAGINLEVVLAECYERMDSIGADGAEGRAVRVLTGLGFSERTVEAPTERLSGGWAMRAALAAALFMQPDLLLLDEVGFIYLQWVISNVFSVAHEPLGCPCDHVAAALAAE